MVNNTVDDIYSSLSDATRREILLKIYQDNLHLSEIAKDNGISLPAVSKHLKVLEKASLIKRQREGREFKFTLTDAARFWVKQFMLLEQFLAKSHKKGGN